MRTWLKHLFDLLEADFLILATVLIVAGMMFFWLFTILLDWITSKVMVQL